MLISCEKCSTTYVLDDKLIPPQGAPVQCTRCQHVFTARVPVAAAASSTMMFGAPVTAQPVADPPAAPPRSTMMFGAAGAAGSHGPVPAPAHTPPSRPSGPHSTAMFGGATTTPQATTGGQPTSRTMMFGAAGAQEAGHPPPSADSPNRTMMFGAEQTQPPAQSGKHTMVFGAVAANAPAATAQPGQPNRTMVFGAVNAAAPTEAQPGQPNRTMMFGAVGAQNAAPAPAHNPNQGPPARSSGTMVFGGVGGPSAPASSSHPAHNPRSTMVFGAPAANAADPTNDGPTPNQGGRTAIFGLAQPPEPDQGHQNKSNTMIFGVSPSGAPVPAPRAAPKLTESTVRIGPDDLERMMREHDALARGEVSTPSEAPAAEAPSSLQDRHGKTQLFAMGDAPQAATPPAGHEAVQARHNKTAMFAMSDVDSAPSRRTSPALQPVDEQPDRSVLDTFPPDGPPRSSTMMFGGLDPAPQPTLVGTTSPELSPLPADLRESGADRVELPPEELAGSDGYQSNPTQPVPPTSADVGDPAAELAAQVSRRNRIAGIVIAVALVVVALAVSWKVFGKLFSARQAPVEAIQGTESALSTLRFDDDESKEKAVKQLTGLVAQYPDFIEGHAGLVTALSLQLDDVQQRVRRLEKDVESLNARVSKLNADKPPDFQAKAAPLSDRATKLSATHKSLAEAGRAVDQRVREAYRGLEEAVTRAGNPSTPARLATIRAQALFHGVSGTDQALVLTKRYETTEDGASDGWIDLAIPEYAANARVSDELVTEALGRLDELHKRDSTFLRAWVLAARLHLGRKDYVSAEDDLEKVLSMRPNHPGVVELKEWARAQQAEKKPEAPAP